MQGYLLKRESERDAFVEQKSQEYNRVKQEYDSIESNFDSIRHVMQQTGLNTAQATQELVGLWKFAEQDPVGYVNHFLNSKGIDLQQLAQGKIDPVQYQQRQLTSKLSALESELNSIKQKNSVEQDQILLSEIQRFASQPENKYFDAVKDDIAFLFDAGKAADLPEAYKMACAINPKVSQLIEMEKAQERAKNTTAKAQAAKAASGVKLKSKEVSSVSRPTAQTDNMEDAVRAVWKELNGDVAA
jgi:prophage DNA circulation protein